MLVTAYPAPPPGSVTRANCSGVRVVTGTSTAAEPISVSQCAARTVMNDCSRPPSSSTHRSGGTSSGGVTESIAARE